MSGHKTILGFTGNSPTPPGTGAGSDEPRASHTIIGHDLHLPTGQVNLRKSVPSSVPPRRSDSASSLPCASLPQRRSDSASLPRACDDSGVVSQSAIDEVTEQLPSHRRPSHSGKTGFPALARLFGRWTAGGTLRRRSSLDGDADLEVPRDPWVQRLVILLGATLLSFVVALVAVKLHQCSTADPPRAAAPPTSLAPRPEPAALPTPAPRPEPVPAPPSTPAPAASAPVTRPISSDPSRRVFAAAVGATRQPSRPARSTAESRSRKAPPAPAVPAPPQPDPDSLLPLAM